MANQEVVSEWLTRGQKDAEEAEFLLKNNRPLEDVGFFIQQAIEKHLKGFLIYNGWELEKIHNLVTLADKAIKIDKRFELFIPFMRKITRYYTESRYPVGYEVEYTKEEIEESLDKAREIIALIKEKIK